MEKIITTHCDKEYMKMAMLKHEETFREQVYELHRLYKIQKILMKGIQSKPQNDRHYETNANQPHLDLKEFNYPKTSGVSQIEDDQMHDLELTLGPKSYYNTKIKAAEDYGPSFSSSSTNGSSHMKRTTKREEMLSNQDRLNSPPWLFQALSLKMT